MEAEDKELCRRLVKYLNSLNIVCRCYDVSSAAYRELYHPTFELRHKKLNILQRLFRQKEPIEFCQIGPDGYSLSLFAYTYGQIFTYINEYISGYLIHNCELLSFVNCDMTQTELDFELVLRGY